MTKVLNLTNLDTSDIKYHVSKFPDGQTNLFIIDKKEQSFHRDTDITIKSRLNNFEDLALIICATRCLQNKGLKYIHLYVPYFMGARSDRQFEEGGNNYLKDIICPIINSLNFESVTVLDPHSNVLEACLNNFKKEDNLRLVNFARLDITPITKNENFVLISPDAGAAHKIYKLAEQIGYKGDIITCSKERNTDGKLTKTIVPIMDGKDIILQYLDKDFIIIDDICDGGRTFINIAKEIKLKFVGFTKQPKLYFIVTHGIFSAGFQFLSEYFDGIYCTNSYKDIKPGQDYDSDLIKQLNVF